MPHLVRLLLAAMEFAKGYGVYGRDFQNHKSFEALHSTAKLLNLDHARQTQLGSAKF